MGVGAAVVLRVEVTAVVALEGEVLVVLLAEVLVVREELLVVLADLRGVVDAVVERWVALACLLELMPESLDEVVREVLGDVLPEVGTDVPTSVVVGVPAAVGAASARVVATDATPAAPASPAVSILTLRRMRAADSPGVGELISKVPSHWVFPRVPPSLPEISQRLLDRPSAQPLPMKLCVCCGPAEARAGSGSGTSPGHTMRGSRRRSYRALEDSADGMIIEATAPFPSAASVSETEPP